MRPWNRPLLALTAGMLVLIVVCLGGLLLDPRSLGGQPIWAKPLKFSVSIALYSATLAWMISLITGERARRWGHRAGSVVAAAGGVEMLIIVGQVARGRGSHFDQATAFDTTLYRIMGGSITVLWLATGVLAVLLLRERTLPRAIGTAVRLGLAVALLGMALAFLMTVPSSAQTATPGMPVSGGHAVGVPDGGPGLPLLGWSTTGGDLRIGHFVGLHGLQGLPLLALGLGLLATRVPVLRSEQVRTRLVVVAAGAWTGLTLLLTGQALRGQPLLAPDPLTLGIGATLVVGTALAAGLVLARAPRPVTREAVPA